MEPASRPSPFFEPKRKNRAWIVVATVLTFGASFIPPPWSYLGPIALGCSAILLLFILANYVYDGE